MKISNENLRNLGAAIFLVLVLFTISYMNRSGERKKEVVETTDSNNVGGVLVSEDGVTTDLRASAQIMGAVVKPEEVERDVREQLGADRQIAIPDIADSKLNINKVNTRQGIAAYINQNRDLINEYNNGSLELIQKLYAESITSKELDTLEKETRAVLNRLYAMPVPQDAVGLHKAIIQVYSAHNNLIEEAQRYQVNPDDSVWLEVYSNYYLENDAVLKMNESFENLTQKYGLSTT